MVNQEFIDSLNDRQKGTFFALEGLNEAVRLLKEKIFEQQMNCDHDFQYESLYEREQYCRICRIEKTVAEWKNEQKRLT